MYDREASKVGSPEQCTERAIGIVIGEVLTAARDAGLDEFLIAPLHALAGGENSALRTSLAEFGIDSLTWMALLTALEEKLDILFPDDVASSMESYTVWGLSRALSDCLSVKREDTASS